VHLEVLEHDQGLRLFAIDGSGDGLRTDGDLAGRVLADLEEALEERDLLEDADVWQLIDELLESFVNTCR
jgi:hypothetical protein